MRAPYKKEHLRSVNLASFDSGLRKLFISQLRRMVWAEREFTKTLPKIFTNISSPNLTSIIKDYAVVSERQVKRLEKMFVLMDKSSRGRKSEVMQSFIKEFQTVFTDTKYGPVRDAAIALVQKVKHYSIAVYGTLVDFSQMLGEYALVDLLSKTLEEEKDTDYFLSQTAYKAINFDAAIDENKYFASHYYKEKTV